jgi:CBS domain-containing protein
MATIRNHVIREIVAVDATSPVKEAARLMSERQIGSVGIRDRGRIVGLVAERDLVATCLAKNSEASMPVREAMRPGIPTVSPDATEAEAAGLMRKHYTRHLLVEEEGEVVGVISMRDVIQMVLDEKQFVIEQLQTYITGY